MLKKKKKKKEKETKWQFWTFKTKQIAFGQGLLTLTEKVQRTKKIICEV